MTSIPLINVDTFWYPPLFPVPKNLQKSKVRRPSLGPLREGEGDKSLSIGNTESAHRRHLSYLYTIFIVSEYLICNVYDVYMIGPVYMICMHDMYTWFAYSHFDNLSQVKHQYKYTDVYIYICFDSFGPGSAASGRATGGSTEPAVDVLPHISLHQMTFWYHFSPNV